MHIEKYFLPTRKLADNQEVRRAILTIKFIWISTFFAVGYFGFSFLTGLLLPRYLMAGVMGLFLLQLFGCKYSLLSVKATGRVFIALCWMVVIILCLGSNGLYSYVLPWLALIPLIALVLLTQRDAWTWSGICVLSVLYFTRYSKAVFPEEWAIKNNALWISSLDIGLLFIILILTFIFNRQQNELIDQVARQNESLKSSQEEIIQQRDTVEMQNRQLQDARQVIEKQHVALLKKNDELEREINIRTKDLVEYTQQLEQFAFVASHNLRAPIARIAGLGNLLELTDREEDEIDIRSKLIASTRELDEVVKDLNLILDIRKGSMTAISEIDVIAAIGQILRNLEKDIEDTRAVLTLDLNSVPKIHSIRPYFDSIFFNLISNAIKYRKPGERPRLHLSARHSEGLARFTLRDNGIGIDLEKYGTKLFKLYGRLHTHVDGKGLGLFLVNTQVKVLGGNVEVESEVGKGSSFHITIRSRLT